MTVSALYAGAVAHRRFAPRDHRLAYPAFQLLLDLDEVEMFDRKLKLFSANRFNLFSHHDRDHGDRRHGGLRAWVEGQAARAGVTRRLGRIQLLAMPRILGFVFNPLCIYYCQDTDARLAAVIYEVNNTFGERHAYVQAVNHVATRRLSHSRAKAFRVSPFLPMDLVYDFALLLPGQAVRSTVDVRTPDGEMMLTATFAGKRRPFSDRSLLATFVRFPLLTLKVVAAIHVEALKLWLKGVRPDPSSLPPRPRRSRLAARERSRSSPMRSSPAASKAPSRG